LRFALLRRRRPSAALVISSAALFVSLGGVGYAAYALPRNSVGTSQIRNGAVTYTKIHAGAVGVVGANTKQLQARVSAACSSTQAISAIGRTGRVMCSSTLPAEFGGPDQTWHGGDHTIATLMLPVSGTYLAFANPEADVATTGPGGAVTITCTLTVGSASQTRMASVETTSPATQTQRVTIPLQVAGPGGPASLACKWSGGNGDLTGAINAIRTARNQDQLPG
jgi:hypothetical protein